MSSYKLSEEAKQYLIRIHQYGTQYFGETQADKYFEGFFDHFDLIANNPNSFPEVNHLRQGYRRTAYGSDSIYYRITDTVEIMAIVGHQDLDGIL
jgi:toxin ParE1/3/4